VIDQAVTFEWPTRFASGGKWRIIPRVVQIESISSTSLICKNTPEICKVNRRRLSVDRELRSFAVDSPLKKERGTDLVRVKKKGEFLSQPTSEASAVLLQL